MVTKDALPFAKTVGNRARIYGINTIGLMRRGFSQDTITKLRRAYRHLLHSNTSRALAQIERDPSLQRPEVALPRRTSSARPSAASACAVRAGGSKKSSRSRGNKSRLHNRRLPIDDSQSRPPKLPEPQARNCRSAKLPICKRSRLWMRAMGLAVRAWELAFRSGVGRPLASGVRAVDLESGVGSNWSCELSCG